MLQVPELRKLDGMLVAAMLPWAVFWAQHQDAVKDGAKLQVTLSTQCERAKPRFEVVVARSAEVRAKGLGGRHAPLGSKEGMLFVFDPPIQPSFWMKDTFIPLQIVFFDTKGLLTSQYFMRLEVDPGNPGRTYDAPGATVAALELAPGSIPIDAVGKSQICILNQ